MPKEIANEEIVVIPVKARRERLAKILSEALEALPLNLWERGWIKLLIDSLKDSPIDSFLRKLKP